MTQAPQNRVVAVARSWIGTPYRHQASTRGAGTDCLGLLRGVWREVFGDEPVKVPAYTPDWAEPGGQEVLLEAARRLLVSRSWPLKSGDVLLFRMRDGSVAKHLGICGEVGTAPSFIHSYSGHGVIETSLSEPWERRIAALFAFPLGGN
jgi:NlpC/P60 family putative phage cell wall peptidase